MQRAYRLKRNAQFQYAYRRGKNASHPFFSLIYARSGGKTLVGFSVSKKIGNAVVRNRVKRRLRECFKKRMPALRPGLYVVVARSAVVDARFEALDRAVADMLARQKLIKE